MLFLFCLEWCSLPGGLGSWEGGRARVKLRGGIQDVGVCGTILQLTSLAFGL